MSIRLAAVGDVPSVMALVRCCVPAMRAAGNFQWGNDYPDAATFLCDVERGELWITEEAPGQLTGVAAITTEQTPEYAQVGWDLEEPALAVHRLAVDPEARGKGLASLLMQQAETVARERGIAVLRVDTSAENPATQKLFPKLDYTYSGDMSLPFRPGLRIVCFEKRLQVQP